MTDGKKRVYSYPNGVHHNSRDLTGVRYGKLVVLRRHHTDGKKWYWECQCDCGNTKIIEGSKLTANQRNGRISNCGCITKQQIGKKNTKHGKTNHPLYWIWRSMKARCLNPKHRAYKNYGGRGITVCDRWLEFQNFWNDVSTSYCCGMDLDRVDNNKGIPRTTSGGHPEQ